MANIDGTPDNDLLESLLGDDVIDGKAGQDTVSYANAVSGVTVDLRLSGVAQDTGGAGIDTLISIERLTGSTFDDHLIGNFGTNFLYGGEGNDWLVGGAGSDRLYGETGNDLLDGGTGADFMRGGEGNDTYYVDNAGDLVEEWWYGGNGGIDTVRARASFTLPQHVEDLTLAGSASIDGTGNAANNTLTGNSGDNALNGGDGFDIASFANATSGVTLIELSQGNSTVSGAGSDKLVSIEGIIGSSYDDIFYGASDFPGNSDFSLIYGGDGNDDIELGTVHNGEAHGGTGNDWVYGGVYADLLYGDEGDDTLGGSYGDDILYGGDGNDRLSGGDDNNRMYGGAGNDRYDVESYGDIVIELASEGHDRIWGNVSFTLPANVEDGEMWGNGSIAGNDLDNVLTVVFPNNGVTYLHGGGGNDRFRFDDYRFIGEMHIDDFTSGQDKISLDAIPGTFVFRGDAGQIGTDDQLWTTHSGGATIVHGYFGGEEQFIIHLTNLSTPLTSSDFFL